MARSLLLVGALVLAIGCSPGQATSPSVGEQASKEPGDLVHTTRGVSGATDSTSGEEPSAVIPTKSEEQDTPPLGFRPDLLLLVGAFGKGAPPNQVWGYQIATGKMGPLTRGGLGHAWPLFPSPDGTHFAYLRQGANSRGGSAMGICVREITGGSAVCQWREMKDRADWRPGTQDISVIEKNGSPHVLRVAGRELGIVPSTQAFFSFSPDGRWSTYWDDGVWVAQVDNPSQKRKLLPDRGMVTWLDSEHLLVVVDPDYSGSQREGKVYLASVDGSTVNIAQPMVNSVSEVIPDPAGRYLAANYGVPASTWRHDGAALYDLQRKTWTKLQAGGGVWRALAWADHGKYLLVVDEKGAWALLDPEGKAKRTLPTDLAGTFEGASPSGAWFAFVTDDTRQLKLYCPSTGELRVVDTGDDKVMGIAWVGP